MGIAVAVATLIALLGQPADSQALAAFERSLEAQPVVESFEDGRTYRTFPKQGISLVLDDGSVSAVQLFADGVGPSMKPYTGELPYEATFRDSRATIVARAGKPSSVNTEHGVRPWIKYRFPNHSIHFEFADDEKSIRMCTLMREPAD